MSAPEMGAGEKRYVGYFIDEVNEQGRALRAMAGAYRDQGSDLLRRAFRAASGRSLLLTGMGSSWAAAIAAEALLVREGRLAVAVETSEAVYRWQPVMQGPVMQGPAMKGPGRLLPILISQSGESPEVVRLGLRLGSDFIAITNRPQSTLARQASVVLPLHAGAEKGVTNQTFLNSVALASLLARTLLVEADEERLLDMARLLVAAEVVEAAAAVESLLARGRSLAETVYAHLSPPPGGEAGRREPEGVLQGWDLIGRGTGLAAVEQGALLLRELTGRMVATFSGGLYRHGPVYRCGPWTRAIVLASSDEEGPLQSRLARDIVDRGGRVAFLSDYDPEIDSGNLLHISLPRVAGGLFPITAMVPLEFLGIVDAAARGLEPGADVPKITPLE